jgi:hypothetical protein
MEDHKTSIKPDEFLQRQKRDLNPPILNSLGPHSKTGMDIATWLRIDAVKLPSFTASSSS